MYNCPLFELLHLALLLFLSGYTIVACSCNDRDREQLHLQRRQALRDRQREAVVSGRSVRSVIETEVEPETTQCPRMTCVRMAPRLKTHNGVNTADVYERLNQGDNAIQKIEKEKPPPVEIPVQKLVEKPPSQMTSTVTEKAKSSKDSSEEWPDERDNGDSKSNVLPFP
ncbi:unnamed protein product [Caenorhabditis sp. 36 PRJEB53466]|nr:unnamed protein product [Caenorhabditis sp. 36 PRJEB53466]